MAAVAAESRNVLSSPAHGIVGRPQRMRIPADRHIHLESKLAPRWTGESVVVRPAVRRGRRWRRLRPQLVPVLREGSESRVQVDIPVAGSVSEAEITLEAWSVPQSPQVTHESPEIEIPDAAVLSFAVGVLDVAWREGPVRFEISLCEYGKRAGNDEAIRSRQRC